MKGGAFALHSVRRNNRCFTSGIDLIHNHLVGLALIHRDLLGSTVGLHGFFEEPQGCGLVAPGRQQKINRLAFLLHRPVEVFPGAFDLDIGRSGSAFLWQPASRFKPFQSKRSA